MLDGDRLRLAYKTRFASVSPMVSSPFLMRVSIFAALGLAPLTTFAQAENETDAEAYPTCNNPQPIPGDLTLESGYARCEDGRVVRHRPDFIAPTFGGEECSPKASLSPFSTCKSSDDCQARNFGTCAEEFSTCRCVYSCMSDLDCRVGEVCAPASLTGEMHSQCIKANCRVNADCASEQCQLSTYLWAPPGLRNSSLGCRTEQDTCSSDADCRDLFGEDPCNVCSFNIYAEKWECSGPCIQEGRPFFVQGEQVLPCLVDGSQWLNEVPTTEQSLSFDQCKLVAQHWISAARMEQASVAAFARFALQLMHLGAPPELLADTSLAMQDEIDHAQRCFTLAAQYSGQAISAGPLALDGALDQELAAERIAVDVFLEGCVGETVAAIEALEMKELASQDHVKETLEVITRDEHKHALLAWRSLDWMLHHLEKAQRQAVLGALLSMTQSLKVELAMSAPAQDLPPSELEKHGVPSSARQKSIRRQAIQEVVLPSALALLERSGGGPRLELERYAAV